MKHTDIEALLADAFPSLVPARLNGKRVRWSLPGAGDGPRVSISVDNNWASLQTKADRACSGAALDALSLQSEWPGAVKHGGGADRPILRVDMPLTADTPEGRAWFVRQLRASRDGMLIVAERDGRTELPPGDSETPHDPELLAYTCSAGGWNTVVKPDGAVRIDLQVRGAQRSVVLRAGEAGIRASVTLAGGALARASAPCRTAAGLFLMRASAALRWARAFASRENGQLDSAGFECSMAAPPDERALLLAVDILIAACELFGREAEVLLEHPEIAERYTDYAGIDYEAGDDSASPGAAALQATVLFPAAHAAIA